MTAVALGAFGVGLVVGLTVGETARRHLRRLNAMLAADAVTARRATVAQRPPDARDWVRRSEVIRLAHIEEQAEAVAAENRDLRRQLAQRSGGAS